MGVRVGSGVQRERSLCHGRGFSGSGVGTAQCWALSDLRLPASQTLKRGHFCFPKRPSRTPLARSRVVSLRGLRGRGVSVRACKCVSCENSLLENRNGASVQPRAGGTGAGGGEPRVLPPSVGRCSKPVALAPQRESGGSPQIHFSCPASRCPQ